jgi:hypothetical protein
VGRLTPVTLLVMLAGSGLCTAQSCSAQSTDRYVEIRIPDGVRSEDAVIRYALTGDDLGRWVNARAGVGSYLIATGRAATMKAVLYAPGCAFETLDLELSAEKSWAHSFTCNPTGRVTLSGKLARPEWLKGRDVRVQVKYVARWASSFLGITRELPLTMRLGGGTPVETDGRFQITVPDFTGEKPAELQVWIVDRKTGGDVAHLIPMGVANSGDRTGSLKIQSSYPGEIVFAACEVARRGKYQRAPLDLIHRDASTPRLDAEEACAH